MIALRRDGGGFDPARGRRRAAAGVAADAVAYTSNFENHPAAVAALAAGRRAAGQSRRGARAGPRPGRADARARRHGFAVAGRRGRAPRAAAARRRWLLKPRRSGGGHGTSAWRPGVRSAGTVPPAADRGRARLDRLRRRRTARACALGLTRQLVGRARVRRARVPLLRQPARAPASRSSTRQAELLGTRDGAGGRGDRGVRARRAQRHRLHRPERRSLADRGQSALLGLHGAGGAGDAGCRSSPCTRDACAGRLPPTLRRARARGRRQGDRLRPPGRRGGRYRGVAARPAIADVPHPGERIGADIRSARSSPPARTPAPAFERSRRRRAAIYRAAEPAREVPHEPTTRVLQSVTCLGCGCGCDDLTVQVRDGRIAELAPPCPLAQAWFGDGQVPARPCAAGGRHARGGDRRRGGRAAGRRRGTRAGAARTRSHAPRRSAPRSPLADTAPRGRWTAPRPTPAAAGMLAAQRRGRAAATLGEIRNRADVVLFWARGSRRAISPLPRALRARARRHARARGRAGRTLISVSSGADRGPAEADVELGSLAGRGGRRAVRHAGGRARQQRSASCPRALQAGREIAERLLAGAATSRSSTTPSPARSQRAIR